MQNYIKEVAKETGRPLSFEEQVKVREMTKEGFTIRQMVIQVKRIAAIEQGNRRRDLYLREQQQQGIGPLTGSEMEKFKRQTDKEYGYDQDWEKQGYPGMYRNYDAAVEKSKKKEKVKKEKKKLSNIEKYKEKQAKAITKRKKQLEEKSCIEPDQKLIETFKQKYKKQISDAMAEVD